MSEGSHQPSLISRFIIDPIKNAHEANMQQSLEHSVKRALRTADSVNNHNGIVEISDISKYTKKNIEELAKGFSPEKAQKALDDVVKIATPAEHNQQMISSAISPRINITQEALDVVHEIINALKSPGNAGKDSTLQAAKPAKNPSHSRGS